MRHLSNSALLKSIIVITCCVCISCATTVPFHEALIQRLKNRGPVPLSSDNPYLAANLLLTKESEKSADFKGFLKTRGTPPAISVEKQFLGDLAIEFFYPNEKEYFVLEQEGENWIIGGPFTLSASALKDLQVLTRNVKSSPPLTVTTSEKKGPLPTFTPTPIQNTPSPTPIPLVTAPFQSPVREVKPPLVEKVTPALTAARSTRETIQEVVGRLKTADAELSPRGDIVHYVVSSQETLEAVATWYTFDKENAARLKRINSIKKDALIPGDSLVIPRYMIKNKSRLTEEALREVAKILSR